MSLSLVRTTCVCVWGGGGDDLWSLPCSLLHCRSTLLLCCLLLAQCNRLGAAAGHDVRLALSMRGERMHAVDMLAHIAAVSIPRIKGLHML